MAGGVWTTMNKVRPGVYVDIASKGGPVGAMGERGTAAIALSLPWGEPQRLLHLTPADDVSVLLGYDVTASEVLLVREALKRAGTLLLYRLNQGVKASAEGGGLKATAKFGGTRGNDLTIIIENNVDDPDAFDVKTVLAGTEVDKQTVQTVMDLQSNNYVVFSGDGPLAATAGFPLTGGDNGTVTNQDHMNFLSALEVEEFQTVALASKDQTLKSLYASYVKRLRESEGKKVQAVLADYPGADYEGVISVKNGVVLSNGTALDNTQAVAWVAGATAAAEVNESLTYQAYDDAVDADLRLTHTETEDALKNGEFLFTHSDGKVIVEQDINTFTSYTPEKAKHFGKNRVVRVLDGIANDLKRIFETSYIGKVDNNADGRSMFWAECVNYLNTLQNIRDIQNFDSGKDIQVSPGTDSDSIFVDVQIQPVDSVEKVYMKVKVV